MEGPRYMLTKNNFRLKNKKDNDRNYSRQQNCFVLRELISIIKYGGKAHSTRIMPNRLLVVLATLTQPSRSTSDAYLSPSFISICLGFASDQFEGFLKSVKGS